ncbi:MAG: hypothetical protein ACM3ZQ_11740, partial [Bacillota bacterium]
EYGGASLTKAYEELNRSVQRYLTTGRALCQTIRDHGYLSQRDGVILLAIDELKILYEQNIQHRELCERVEQSGYSRHAQLSKGFLDRLFRIRRLLSIAGLDEQEYLESVQQFVHCLEAIYDHLDFEVMRVYYSLFCVGELQLCTALCQTLGFLYLMKTLILDVINEEQKEDRQRRLYAHACELMGYDLGLICSMGKDFTFDTLRDDVPMHPDVVDRIEDDLVTRRGS